LSGSTRTTAPANESAPDFDFARAAEILTAAAARAGAAIMEHYGQDMTVALKDDQSPVTCADTDSEAILLEALKALAPDIAVVSEETAADRTKPLPPRFFLVDPLDGTKEFIKQRSDFTVNVALVENAQSRFGLVYAPAHHLLAVTLSDGHAVEATLGPSENGADFARLDVKPLKVRTPAANGLVAVVSQSHLDPETERFLSGLKIKGRSSAGSSLKFLLVAKGEADVYPRFGPTMEWDTAAGQAVLVAAGGQVIDSEGKPLRYGKTAQGLRNGGFVAWGAQATA
jgi:3'(2'), 5'-bisphosphate nucleotidase